MVHGETLNFQTRGRGTTEITPARFIGVVQRVEGRSRALHRLHSPHECVADRLRERRGRGPARSGAIFARLVPDGDPDFRHTDEGPDDMPAHVRSILTQTSISLPVFEGRCDLGTWQGIYLWEHRTVPHRRRVTVTVLS